MISGHISLSRALKNEGFGFFNSRSQLISSCFSELSRSSADGIFISSGSADLFK